MKRRNFLTLFPIAGFAAAFGIKLKAEPIALNITQTPIRVSIDGLAAHMRFSNERMRPMIIDEVHFYSGPLNVQSLAYDEKANAGRVTYI